jgi:hypothetical protein
LRALPHFEVLPLTFFWRLSILAFLVLVPGIYAQDQSKFWPELDTYVNLNSHCRFFFIAQVNSDQDSRQIQGQFGPNFDFYLRPFLRPRLNDLDPAKAKLLTFRVGTGGFPRFAETARPRTAPLPS